VRGFRRPPQGAWLLGDEGRACWRSRSHTAPNDSTGFMPNKTEACLEFQSRSNTLAGKGGIEGGNARMPSNERRQLICAAHFKP
jgi:hypothetical protein